MTRADSEGSFSFSCGSCGARVQSHAKFVGLRVECPSCGTVVSVPALGTPVEPMPSKDAAPSPTQPGSDQPPGRGRRRRWLVAMAAAVAVILLLVLILLLPPRDADQPGPEQGGEASSAGQGQAGESARPASGQAARAGTDGGAAASPERGGGPADEGSAQGGASHGPGVPQGAQGSADARSPEPPEPTRDPPTAVERALWAKALLAVRRVLKNPDSAKFPELGERDTAVRKKGREHLAEGYVIARNLAGKEIRKRFRVRLVPHKGDWVPVAPELSD